MRKLLIFMLILGMASLANAGLIDVVVDYGRGGWVDNNANDWLDASDIIRIKVTTSLMLASFDLGLNVMGPHTLGEYVVGATLGPGPNGYPGNHVDDGMMGGMWVYSGIVGNSIATMADATFGPGMTGDLVWALDIHCGLSGGVDVNLTLGANLITQDVGGYVVQPDDLGHLFFIPEPATLLLLGLGGLALRKQRFGFRRSRVL